MTEIANNQFDETAKNDEDTPIADAMLDHLQTVNHYNERDQKIRQVIDDFHNGRISGREYSVAMQAFDFETDMNKREQEAQKRIINGTTRRSMAAKIKNLFGCSS